MRTATRFPKTFADWLAVYDDHRDARPVLTRDELRAAYADGCDPTYLAVRNDDLAAECDACLADEFALSA